MCGLWLLCLRMRDAMFMGGLVWGSCRALPISVIVYLLFGLRQWRGRCIGCRTKSLVLIPFSTMCTLWYWTIFTLYSISEHGTLLFFLFCRAPVALLRHYFLRHSCWTLLLVIPVPLELLRWFWMRAWIEGTLTLFSPLSYRPTWFLGSSSPKFLSYRRLFFWVLLFCSVCYLDLLGGGILGWSSI